MFNKKNRKNQEPEYLLSSFDRLEHRALLANFEKLSIEYANYMLTFLSGAVYGLKGEVHKIHTKTFLFGAESEYKDGTLNQYLKERE